MHSLSNVLTSGHAFLVGRTGSGKTTALIDALVHQAACGRGLVFIDPHGDAALELRDKLPRFRRNDVVFVDPTLDASPGLNPFARVTDAERPLVVAGLVATMKKIFASAWGSRTEHLLRSAFAAVAEVRSATLEDAARMLFDERHRAWVLRQVNDPATRRFWTEEVPGYSKQLFLEAIAAPLNKLGGLMGDPRVRHALTKDRPRLNWSRALTRNAIVIVRLPKGVLGEINVTVLGSFVLGAVQVALMRRAECDLAGRPSCVVAVDEFWNFAPEPLAELLSEGRKYGLLLMLACQSASMLDASLRSSLLANAGLVAFRTSGEDAELLAPEFANEYGPTTLTALSVGEAVIRAGPERGRVVRFAPP